LTHKLEESSVPLIFGILVGLVLIIIGFAGTASVKSMLKKWAAREDCELVDFFKTSGLGKWEVTVRDRDGRRRRAIIHFKGFPATVNKIEAQWLD